MPSIWVAFSFETRLYFCIFTKLKVVYFSMN